LSDRCAFSCVEINILRLEICHRMSAGKCAELLEC
jgi:hypothetical protein